MRMVYASPQHEDIQTRSEDGSPRHRGTCHGVHLNPSRLTAASNNATAMVQNGALNAAFRQSMQLECVIWRKIYPRQYLAELL